MTREEAVERIKMILEEATASEDAVSYVTSDDADALDMAIKALEQEPVLDKVRNEIAECGSIWVAYAITGHSDRDIENLIEGVLKQAKEQVLNIIDKYRTESEEEK
jgi:hypothetical protein